MMIAVESGLPVPAVGEAITGKTEDANVDRVGLPATDYAGMRPKLLVSEGRQVEAGTPLFHDRRRPQITVTSPVSGRVETIVFGAKRRLSSIEIVLDGDERRTFAVGDGRSTQGLRTLMLDSGMWPALRARPFERVPDPDAIAAAIFVTAIDTHPGAPDPLEVLAGHEEEFARGVRALRHLASGEVFVCQTRGPALVEEDAQTIIARFSGHHPAGLAGTHIALLHPASRQSPVWHIGYQDVVALGTLLTTGQTTTSRTITVAGPGVRRARQVRVPLGADLHVLVRSDLTPGQKRVLSGSVLGGHESQYLSRYHVQASVLNRAPPQPRNWLVAALRQVATTPAFVPTQAVERALGPKLHVVPLLRALSIGDVETAERLGCLQLAEEDVALAAYATGGDVDYGARLRAVLDSLEAS